MKQNKLFFCAASLIAGLALTVACKDDTVIEVEDPTLEVAPASYDVASANGGSVTITVTSNKSWVATPDAEWITVSDETDASFVVTAAANTATEPRTGTVTVKAETLTRTVTVTQVGNVNNETLLSIAPTTKDVPADGGTLTLTVTSNADWAAASSDEWATVTPASGSKDGEVTVTVAENTLTKAREATITLTAGTVTATAKVTQAAAEEPSLYTPLVLPYSTSGVIKDADVFTKYVMPWGESNALVLEAKFTEATSVTIVPSLSLVLFIYDDATTGSWTWLANPNTATETPFDYTFAANKRYYLVFTIAGGSDANSSYTLAIAKEGDIPTLGVAPASASVPEEGAASDFAVTSNVDWTVTSSEDWATVSPLSGSKNGTITVTSEANTGEAREATITVTAGTLTKTVTVTQAASSSVPVSYPLEVVLSAATPSVQKTGNIAADENPSFAITVPADGTLSITGVHDWYFWVSKDGTDLVEFWLSEFSGSIAVTAGTYLFESLNDYENPSTDYDFTFTFEETLPLFGAVQDVTTIIENDFAGNAALPGDAAAYPALYQIAYPITFGEADKDYSIMIKGSGSLPGEFILCQNSVIKDKPMPSIADIYAHQGSLRYFIEDNHPYNRLTNSESRGSLGGNPNQLAISDTDGRWVRIVPGGTYYIIITRANLSFTGSYTLDVKVQQVNFQ